MSNGQCHVGASNKAMIEANEKRINELADSVDEMLKRLDETHRILLDRMDNHYKEFAGRFEKITERFASRPSWGVMFLLTGLCSLSVGLLVYLARGF